MRLHKFLERLDLTRTQQRTVREELDDIPEAYILKTASPDEYCSSCGDEYTDQGMSARSSADPTLCTFCYIDGD